MIARIVDGSRFEEFKERFVDTELFFDPFAGPKFANYLFNRHDQPDERFTADTAKKTVEEANLFIDAAQHRTGVGRALQDSAFEEMRVRGYTRAHPASRTTTELLFLLDELFHGTNSHDRRIGAEAIKGWTANESGRVTLYTDARLEHKFIQQWLEMSHDAYRALFPRYGLADAVPSAAGCAPPASRSCASPNGPPRAMRANCSALAASP